MGSSQAQRSCEDQEGRRGQSLVELLVGLSLAGVIIGASVFAVTAFLRSDLQAKRLQAATGLARELSDNVRAFSAANWRNIYDLTKGSSDHYYLITTVSPFASTTGDQTLTVESVNYTRYFYVENANRTLCGAGAITESATTTCAQVGATGVAADPSTQRITVVATWPGTTSGVRLIEYVSRARNTVTQQTDWSGGGGQESFPSGGVNNQFASSTGIDFSGTPGAIKAVLP